MRPFKSRGCDGRDM